MRFRGTFQHTIDAKGRLSVPNRFRDVLKANEDSRLVVTRGTGACLSVYPMDRWLKVEEDLDNLPAGQARDDFIRHFISPAQDVSLDKMGRMLIPVTLREEAGLDKDVVIVGAVSKFEIWDRERYARYMEESRDQALELLKTHDVRF
ncbi:MAG: division/cell wall cluster transcriptional repressor MraZ [Thermodesulfobacteriota bacterium]